MADSTLTSAFQLALRSAVSAGVALAIAQRLELQYPIYALVGAVIVSDLSPSETRQLGLRRLAGTVLGAIVGAAVGPLLPRGPWAIGISILTAMYLSALFRLDGAAKIAGYVCGIIVLSHGDHPWLYAIDRLVETLLGVGVAALVSLVPKLIRVET